MFGIIHKFSIFSTCHSLTLNCFISSFSYSVILFLSLALFHLFLSILLSSTRYLPITSFSFSFFISYFFSFSLQNTFFSCRSVLNHWSILFSLYSILLPELLFYLLFTTFPSLFPPLIYTIIITVWDNLVVWL